MIDNQDNYRVCLNQILTLEQIRCSLEDLALKINGLREAAAKGPCTKEALMNLETAMTTCLNSHRDLKIAVDCLKDVKDELRLY